MMEKQEVKNDGTLDVEYESAKLYKRWFAFFIDLILAFIIGLMLSTAIGKITTLVPAYTNIVEERYELEKLSGLYDDKGNLILLNVRKSESTVTQKKDVLKSTLEAFYQNESYFGGDAPTYYNEYQLRKKEAVTSEGKPLFVPSLENDKVFVESTMSDQIYYDFYDQEFEKYAIAYLSLNVDFTDATNLLNRISIIELAISLSLGYSLTFLIVPFIIKRGRRTLGMYLFKISVISSDALNVTGKTLLARNLLLLLVGFWLSIFTFGLPWIVSVTIMHLTKTKQDFFDYVTNTYVVESGKKDVYLNYAEFLSRQQRKETASIENNNFQITR